MRITLCVLSTEYKPTLPAAERFFNYFQGRELLVYHSSVSLNRRWYKLHLLCFAGFCMFVLSLVKKHYRLQFYMVCITRFAVVIHVMNVTRNSHVHMLIKLFRRGVWKKC